MEEEEEVDEEEKEEGVEDEEENEEQQRHLWGGQSSSSCWTLWQHPLASLTAALTLGGGVLQGPVALLEQLLHTRGHRGHPPVAFHRPAGGVPGGGDIINTIKTTTSPPVRLDQRWANSGPWTQYGPAVSLYLVHWFYPMYP